MNRVKNLKLALIAGVVACMLALLSAVSFAADGAPWPERVGAPRADGANHAALRILRNPGFATGHDRRRGRAAWAAYRVTPVGDYMSMPRPDFEPDPRLSENAPRDVYEGPRFDRGHLAPNYAMAQLYGDAAQRASFYYSNIAPQTPRLNQLVWQRLEETEIDDLAPRLDTLWVIVGPIYGGPDADVPTAYFRIWLDRTTDGSWRAMALRVPQSVRGDERLDSFLVSVDAIERATGLDFFAGLSKQVQSAMETELADASAWGFDELACMPARYGARWQDRDGVYLRYDRCD